MQNQSYFGFVLSSFEVLLAAKRAAMLEQQSAVGGSSSLSVRPEKEKVDQLGRGKQTIFTPL